MDTSCATCAQSFDSPSKSVSEKPLLPGRYLYCCGRCICSRCLNQNKRYETYCPYCQITTEPSLLPQGLKVPPAYSQEDEQKSVILRKHINLEEDDDQPPAYTSHAYTHPAPEKSSDNEPAPDVLHFLNPNDSIHSLSLAYGVPMNALRNTNNVFSDRLLQGRKTILIPGEYYKAGVSLSPRPIEGEEEEARKNKVRRWMVACKVVEYDVALLYLQQAEWDLDVAVEACKDDERWEQEHPLQAKERARKGKMPKDVGMRRFVGGAR